MIINILYCLKFISFSQAKYHIKPKKGEQKIKIKALTLNPFTNSLSLI